MIISGLFRRGKAEDILTVFVDTNTFLHYSPLEVIDWRRIAETKKVSITISDVVLRELDKIKYENRSLKIKERARESLKRIEKYASSKQDENIDLSFVITDHLNNFNYYKYGLDPHLADDRIIADIITFRRNHKKSFILLLTNDFSFSLRAKNYKIDCAGLGDEYRLKEVPDENEKKIKQLERELSSYKDKSPQPKIHFSSGEDKRVFKIRKPYEPQKENINRIIRRIRRSNPRKETKSETGPFDIMGTVVRAEIERYNKQYDDYETLIGKYVRQSTEWKNIVRRTIKIDLILFNHGNTPAEDIDISLLFPSSVRLIRSDYFPRLIGKPVKPDKPKTTIEKVQENASLLRNLLDKSIEDEVESKEMKIVDNNMFELHINRIKHNRLETLPVLYVFFPYPEEPMGFKIEYRINSGTVSKDARGRIFVIIKK